MWVSLLMALCATAQTRTDTIEYRPPYSDLMPFKCIRTIPYSTIDGEKKINGTMTVSGKSGWDAGQHNDNQQYSESRTYVKGMLNGTFRQTYHHSGSGVAGGRYKINRSWLAEGTFKNGLPDGLWTFSLNSRYNSPDDKSNTILNEKVVFNQGHISSIVDQAGNRIVIDADGLVDGKGNIKGGDNVTLKKSIITNIFTDITGETQPTSEKERRLIDDIIRGELTLFTLADKGYTIDWQEVFLAQWARCAEHCDRYAKLSSFAPRFRSPKYTVRIGRLTEIETVRDESAVEYYRQRNKEYDNLKTKAHYSTRYGKRYLSSNAESEIDHYWRMDQERIISKALVELSKMQSNKDLTGCASDDGAIYELVELNDIKTSANGRCMEVYSLLDNALQPISPVIGCKVDSISWFPYNGYKATCRIFQMRPDSIGHNSYTAMVEVDYNGHLLLEQLATSGYTKIRNIWDTVDSREHYITMKHNELLTKLNTIKRWRDQYAKAFDDAMLDRTPKAEVRLGDIDSLESLQLQLESNITLFEQIDSLDHSAERYKQYRKLRSLYEDFVRESDIEWNDQSRRLSQFITIQRRYLQLIENKTPQEMERTANLYKIKDIYTLIDWDK